MSAINEFKIVGIVSQNTIIKKTTNNKIAYCVIRPLNSETYNIPVIAFGDTAIKLNYLGRKGNMIQVLGNITSNQIKKNNKIALEVSLVANEIILADFKQKTKISDKYFIDLFELYDLPKYNPPKRR